MTGVGFYARGAPAHLRRSQFVAATAVAAVFFAVAPVFAESLGSARFSRDESPSDCMSDCSRVPVAADSTKVAFNAATTSQSADPTAAIEIPQAASPPPPGPQPEGPSPVESSLPNPVEQQPPEQVAPINLPPVATLNEFLMNGDYTSMLGVQVREATSSLNSGGEVEGLAVEAVTPNSPAARAGILPYRAATHYVIDGVFAAASFVFPPAMLFLVVADQSRIGTSFDLIIGVDGVRVTNILEFDEQVRNSKPGDIVYLNVVRKGRRIQIPVEVPRATVTANK